MDSNQNGMYDNNQPNQQNQYGQPNQQNPYGQPPYMNNGYMQPPYGEVKDIFCNILLVIMPVRIILALIMNVATFSAIGDYNSFMHGSYIHALGGAYTVLSILSNLLLIAYIVFIILDIVGVSKAKYKVTGLVLFAIFLNAGYYIWRAYVLGRKKTAPIIYTVAYSILLVVNMIVTFYYSFHMTYGIVQSFM